MSPLLTSSVFDLILAAIKRGETRVCCSLDLSRTQSEIELTGDGFSWQGALYSLPPRCKERTVYYWAAGTFAPVSRFGEFGLIKLVATDWGAPTFEIDGIKMLPTAQLSPYEDAKQKVALIEPTGKTILDTCGGLGYFASWCLQSGAKQVHSFEKNPDVVWLRSLNPWSPSTGERLSLTQGNIADEIERLPSRAFDAALHDPPRFGIAGELYSQSFYDHLARILKPRGKLFHYTGSPNKLTSGRDVPNEVAKRLRQAGFSTEIIGDGVLAIKRN